MTWLLCCFEFTVGITPYLYYFVCAEVFVFDKFKRLFLGIIKKFAANVFIFEVVVDVFADDYCVNATPFCLNTATLDCQ